jgi:hypothetical protein
MAGALAVPVLRNNHGGLLYALQGFSFEIISGNYYFLFMVLVLNIAIMNLTDPK